MSQLSASIIVAQPDDTQFAVQVLMGPLPLLTLALQALPSSRCRLQAPRGTTTTRPRPRHYQFANMVPFRMIARKVPHQAACAASGLRIERARCYYHTNLSHPSPRSISLHRIDGKHVDGEGKACAYGSLRKKVTQGASRRVNNEDKQPHPLLAWTCRDGQANHNQVIPAPCGLGAAHQHFRRRSGWPAYT